jgi:hypothetical protein
MLAGTDNLTNSSVQLLESKMDVRLEILLDTTRVELKVNSLDRLLVNSWAA